MKKKEKKSVKRVDKIMFLNIIPKKKRVAD